jgi:hypothetical protein
MKRIAAGIVELLQLIVFMIAMPIDFVGEQLRRLSRWIIRNVYYRVCVVTKRRLRGEDTWKEIDWQIGIDPPKDHPAWSQVQELSLEDIVKPTEEQARAASRRDARR